MDPTEPTQDPASASPIRAKQTDETHSFDGSDQLHRMVFHSLSSAVCAIVPVPFLDDHLVKLTRRRMTRELAGARGLSLEPNDVAVLSGTESKPWGLGCFVGVFVSLAFKIVIKVLRRIFRTILFWLLVKDAADAASRTFHEGYLIDGVLRRRAQGDVESLDMSPSTMRSLVRDVLRQIDTRSLTGGFRAALRGGRSALMGGARRLSKLVGLRREPDGGAQSLEDEMSDTIPSGWVERATAALQREGQYLHRLDELLAEQVFLAQSRARRDPERDTIAT